MKTTFVAGIYAIVNRVNDHAYIGSTIYCLARRRASHRCLLAKGKHGNARLQRAWKKYGAENFDFVILERIEAKDKSTALIKEQEWIERWSRCSECYNLTPAAGPEGDRFARRLTQEHRERIKQRQTRTYHVYLVSPDGTLYEVIHNLNEFAQVHNLHGPTLNMLVHGKVKSHRGWWRLDTPVFGDAARLAKFRERVAGPGYGQRMSEQSRRAMQNAAHKERCTAALRDPIIREQARKTRLRREYDLVAPDGSRHHVIDLFTFCHERDLNMVCMRQLFTSKGRLHSYKGWTKG